MVFCIVYAELLMICYVIVGKFIVKCLKMYARKMSCNSFGLGTCAVRKLKVTSYYFPYSLWTALCPRQTNYCNYSDACDQPSKYPQQFMAMLDAEGKMPITPPIMSKK